MKPTIVFIHGMFQNPESWNKWTSFFEAKGYSCVAPAWPFHEGEPSALRANPPEGLGELALETIVDKMEAAVLAAGEKPVVIGHSVGGLIVQRLVNKGITGAGVAINSVAPNKMLAFDWGLFRNTLQIANPFAGDKIFEMTPEGFFQNFANTMTEAESNAAYEAFATHDSRNVFRDCLGEPGEVDTEFPHPPLLFIGGEKDQIIPPELNEKNAKAYTDEASVTMFKEFAGRGHFICGQPGWEEVAEYVAGFLEKHLPA